MTTECSLELHPFERAGMGKAPYRFVGAIAMPNKSLLETNPDAYYAALRDMPRLKDGNGTCSCCGMAITDIFVVRSAEGDLYGVGCDCVAKTERKADTSDDRTLRDKVKRAARQIATNKRHAREALRTQELDRLMADPTTTEKLKAQPSPIAYRREQGDTMHDWAVWMRTHAGQSGRDDVLRTIKRL